KSGRIGRIKLELSVKKGKTQGRIILPSSMNKIETAIIAATLESVNRVGPCDCKISLESLDDVRQKKRNAISKRAAEIMKNWEIQSKQAVDDLSAKVEKDSKRGKIVEFGPEKLPAGSGIYQDHEIIVVEGRADIINLLNMRIENTIAIQGTKVPSTIKNLGKSRELTALLDGDRGGDLILKELALMTRIDFVARAPFKKEIEDLSHREVQDALKNKTKLLDSKFLTENNTVRQFLENERGSFKTTKRESTPKDSKNGRSRLSKFKQKVSGRGDKGRSTDRDDRKDPKDRDRSDFKKRSSGRFGKRTQDRGRSYERHKIEVPDPLIEIVETTKTTLKAVLIGKSHKPIITVKNSEVYETLKITEGVESLVLDGVITQRLLDEADAKSVKFVIGALLGNIKERPKNISYTTFNRI
ncbi:MAG: DNA primase, partial [Candidatus Heimdallarchaeota archaeon]|nr:DNA primase [Candidatus Heimdallarchaeota archaeon]